MPLKVTLELIPRGDETKKEVLGTLDIENTGDHPKHPDLGNYVYIMTGPPGCVWHAGILHDAQRTRGAWDLVKSVLAAVDCEADPA